MSILENKRVLGILLLFCCAVHGVLMSRWMNLWGFWGAILHWFETFRDPISAAAGFDLVLCMIFVFIWMYVREGRWTLRLTIVLIPFIVFPAIGTLLYLMMSAQSLRGSRPTG